MQTYLLYTIAFMAYLSSSLSVSANESLLVLEQAEIVVSNARVIPDDTVAWQTVNLPDNWYYTQPGLRGTASLRGASG